MPEAYGAPSGKNPLAHEIIVHSMNALADALKSRQLFFGIFQRRSLSQRVLNWQRAKQIHCREVGCPLLIGNYV